MGGNNNAPENSAVVDLSADKTAAQANLVKVLRGNEMVAMADWGKIEDLVGQMVSSGNEDLAQAMLQGLSQVARNEKDRTRKDQKYGIDGFRGVRNEFKKQLSALEAAAKSPVIKSTRGELRGASEEFEKPKKLSYEVQSALSNFKEELLYLTHLTEEERDTALAQVEALVYLPNAIATIANKTLAIRAVNSNRASDESAPRLFAELGKGRNAAPVVPEEIQVASAPQEERPKPRKNPFDLSYISDYSGGNQRGNI